MERVRVGCCGFPKSRRQYFSIFNLVEVQQTFYRPPPVETVLKWRKEAPADFEFTVKAWQLITHPPSSPTYRRLGWKVSPAEAQQCGFFRPTAEVLKAWEKTRDIAQALGARVVVFQTPASFVDCAQNIENMQIFFKKLGQENFLFVWEPRGRWSDKSVSFLCQELRLTHCVDPLERPPLWGDFRYFRLHGGPNYKHKYTDEELRRLRDMVDTETYVLFNNIEMYDDALRFNSLLGE